MAALEAYDQKRRHWQYLGLTPAGELPAVQWSARRLGDVVWLIVSHGYRPLEDDRAQDVDLTTLGSFGFDSDLGIRSAAVVDATGMTVPAAFPHDPTVTLDDEEEEVELAYRHRFEQIDAMLIRIELGNPLWFPRQAPR